MVTDEILMHLVLLPLTYKGEARKHIKEVLGMTQVGKMLMDEGREEGDYARAKKRIEYAETKFFL